MYTHIKNADDLKAAISELKAREIREKLELKNNFHQFTESIKPGNLIRSSLHKVTSNPSGIAGSVIKASIGFGVGMLSKKLLVGRSTSLVKKLAGQAVKLGVTGLIARKSDQIKYAGLKFLTNIIGKKKTNSQVL